MMVDGFILPAVVLALAAALAQVGAGSGVPKSTRNQFAVQGDKLLLNGRPFKVVGLRTSNALISDGKTQELIDNLDAFKAYGVNTVSVFLMGSRFGDVKGYRSDSTLDPVYAARLGRIIEAADRRGMVVLVGCLYWGNSKAKEHLDDTWTQAHANRAIANTITFLSKNGYRNVFVDVDNEGMARRAKGWSIAEMIDAAHAVDRTIMIAWNCDKPPPDSANLLVHHSPKVPGRPWVETEGTPSNAPGKYWSSYSKQAGYYNYIRIGRYTPAMKVDQLARTYAAIDKHNGYMCASTYLQCAPSEGVDGPFMSPGGLAENKAIDADVTKPQPGAGIRWWLEAVQARYGPWMPPPRASSKKP